MKLLMGTHTEIREFLIDYVERRRDKILDRRLNIRDPKRDTLEEVAGMLAECRVYPLEW